MEGQWSDPASDWLRTVEALLTDTLVSGQLYLRSPCLKPRFIQTLYFYILVSGHSLKRPQTLLEIAT